MGYRSDVAYVIGFKDRQVMSEFIAVVMAVGTDHQRDALKECHLDWEHHSINFHESDVKWYDDFPEVQAHHELMEMALERDEKNGFSFTRLGEDMNDVQEETEGNYDGLYECVDIVRTLNVNMDTTPIGEALSSDIPEEYKQD